MRGILTFLTLSCFVVNCGAGETPATGDMPAESLPKGLIFHASFDGNTQASYSAGNSVSSAKTVTFGIGVANKALTGGKVTYESKGNIDKHKGTLMLWVCPKEDLKPDMNYEILSESPPNEPGRNKLSLWIWGWGNGHLRFGVREKKDAYILHRLDYREWKRGVWHHIAATWDCTQGKRLYLDGRFAGLRQNTWTPLEHNSFSIKADRMYFDDLKIFNRVLSEKEILAEYGKFYSQSRLEVPGAVRLGAQKPYFVRVPDAKGRQGNVTVTVTDATTGIVVCETTKDFKSQGAGLYAQMAFPDLKPGMYHFDSVAQLGVLRDVRCKYVGVFDASPRVIESSDKNPAMRLIDEVDLTDPNQAGRIRHNNAGRIVDSPIGKYFESGAKKKFEYISVQFRIEHPGRLHILEIDYPDDADRQMSVSIHTDGSTYQNDLGGIPTGVDIPLTNTMKTFRALFMAWPKRRTPGHDTVVFIQNWWNKHRAAAAKVRIYEIMETPKPPVIRNKAFHPRLLGVYCEDANGFRRNLGMTWSRTPPVEVQWHEALPVLGKLMSHCGQNLFHFPVYWYGGSQYGSKVIPPRHPDKTYGALLSAWLLSAEHYGYKLIFNITPAGQSGKQIEIAKDLEGAIQRGWLQMSGATNKLTASPGNVGIKAYHHIKLKFMGKRVIGCLSNPLHPDFEKIWWDFVEEIIGQHAESPALAGLSIRMVGSYASLLCFKDLKSGYGDYTVGLYEKERGISIPVASDDPERFSKRYRWLIKNRKEDWIRWRCDKLTPRLIRTAEYIKKKNPQLKLYLDLYAMPTDTQEEYLEQYRHMGIDLERLIGNPLIVMLKRVSPNYDRQKLVYRDRKEDIENYYRIREQFENHTQDRFATGAFMYNKYYETLYKRTKKKRVKPRDIQFGWKFIGHGAGGIRDLGRRNLRGYVRELAALDAKLIMTGGWGLEILGHERELREFAKAYFTLEDADYAKMANVPQPLTIRERKAGGGHAFYVVNEEEYSVKLKLRIDHAAAVKDLVTDRILPQEEGILSVELPPYSLRSYCIKNGEVKISVVSIGIPEEQKDTFRQQLERLNTVLGMIPDANKERPQFQTILSKAKTALAEKRWLDYRRCAYGSVSKKLLRFASQPGSVQK